jgi:WD repeat-containing protein 61
MPIRSVGFSRDSNSVFTASDDRHVNIYDISAEGSPNIKATVSGHGSWVLSVACSQDFKHFATAYDI